jgi:hypothetical protein
MYKLDYYISLKIQELLINTILVLRIFLFVFYMIGFVQENTLKFSNRSHSQI